VIGLITALSAYALKDDLNEMIMGGRHFCYFKTIPSEAKNLDGPFQLWLVAPDGPVFDVNYWISEAGTTAKEPGYWSLDQNKPPYPIITMADTLGIACYRPAITGSSSTALGSRI
jgi:hypothetical protein